MGKLPFLLTLFLPWFSFLKGVFNLFQVMEEMMMMSDCVKFPHLASCPAQSDGENGASATRCPPITIIQTHTPMIIGTRMMMMIYFLVLFSIIYFFFIFFWYNMSKPRYECMWSYIYSSCSCSSTQFIKLWLLQEMLNGQNILNRILA